MAGNLKVQVVLFAAAWKGRWRTTSWSYKNTRVTKVVNTLLGTITCPLPFVIFESMIFRTSRLVGYGFVSWRVCLLANHLIWYNYYQPWKLTYAPWKWKNWWVGRWDSSLEQEKMVPFQGTCVDFSGGIIYLVITACNSSPKADRPHFHQTGPHFLKAMKIQVFLDGFDLSGGNLATSYHPHWYLSVVSKKTVGSSPPTGGSVDPGHVFFWMPNWTKFGPWILGVEKHIPTGWTFVTLAINLHRNWVGYYQ